MHWYKFNITGGLKVICKASRKKEIQEVLPFEADFSGCVARSKLHDLRVQDDYIVLNSVARLRAFIPILKQHVPSLFHSSTELSQLCQ